MTYDRLHRCSHAPYRRGPIFYTSLQLLPILYIVLNITICHIFIILHLYIFTFKYNLFLLASAYVLCGIFEYKHKCILFTNDLLITPLPLYHLCCKLGVHGQIT